MQIRGINDAYTKGTNEVAFDLSEQPDAEVMSRVKLVDGVTAKVVNGVVILKTEYEPLPLKSTHVEAFLLAYNTAENELKRAARKAEAERRAMLSRISESLDLPLTSQLSDED